MTVKLPQKAGFVATPDEWDALVRIAENLAAQVVQRDAALRQTEAERDAARAEVARLRLALEDAYIVGDVVQMRLYIAAAPAQDDDAREAMIEILDDEPAPAGGEATK